MSKKANVLYMHSYCVLLLPHCKSQFPNDLIKIPYVLLYVSRIQYKILTNLCIFVRKW